MAKASSFEGKLPSKTAESAGKLLILPVIVGSKLLKIGESALPAAATAPPL